MIYTSTVYFLFMLFKPSLPLIFPYGLVTMTKELRLEFSWLKWIFDTFPKVSLVERYNPINSLNKQQLDLSISKPIKYYYYKDPSPKSKLSITVTTIHVLAQDCHFSTHHSADRDLATIAFFFLLQVKYPTNPYR